MHLCKNVGLTLSISYSLAVISRFTYISVGQVRLYNCRNSSLFAQREKVRAADNDGELLEGEGEMWGPGEKQSLMLLISNYIPRQMKVQVVHQPHQRQ